MPIQSVMDYRWLTGVKITLRICVLTKIFALSVPLKEHVKVVKLVALVQVTQSVVVGMAAQNQPDAILADAPVLIVGARGAVSQQLHVIDRMANGRTVENMVLYKDVKDCVGN